jgi:uncharacterized protein (DUF427 family)
MMEATMKAIWNGRTIAESDRTKETHGYHYFPRESVRMELLQKAPKTASDLECPHGVQFYDVVEGKHVAERAAWSYEKPGNAMKGIGHWVSFWNEVEVR